MSLTHRDYSGFFPFWTVPYSGLPSGWGYEMPLAMLMKCHWLAKSATLTAAVDYNYSATGTEYHPISHTTETTVQSYVGNITGSCVISDAASGSSLMPFLPAARAAYLSAGTHVPRTAGGPSGLIYPPSGGFLGFTDAGISTFTDSLFPSEDGSSTYSNPFGSGGNQSLGVNWFNGMPLDDTLIPQGPVAWDQVANKWYTDLFANLIGSIGPGEPIINLQTIKGTSDVDFQLNVSGLTTTIPMTNTYSLVSAETLTISGTVTLEIDGFWTP